MVLDASLLNTQHYKVRIKGKVGQSREGVAPSPTPWCSSYRKGSLRVTLDYRRQLYLLSIKVPIRKKKAGNLFNDPHIYIYIYIYLCVCVCVCIKCYIYIRIFKYLSTQMYIYICVCVCVCITWVYFYVYESFDALCLRSALKNYNEGMIDSNKIKIQIYSVNRWFLLCFLHIKM